MHIGNIKVCRGTIFAMIFGGSLGALAGGVAGYFAGKKISEKRFEEYSGPCFVACDINEEQEDEPLDIENDEHYEDVNPLDESNKKKEQIVSQLIARSENYVSTPGIEAVDNDELEEHNLFDDVANDPDVIEAMEISENIGGEPYVISYEEYFETCKDFVKTTIGWYPKEHILADENNAPIPEDEWSDWLGDDWQHNFGQGPSYDGDVVFIRNPYTHHDYEVINFKHEEYDEQTYDES